MVTRIKYILLISLAVIITNCMSGSGGNSFNADYSDELGANGYPTPRALFARYTSALGGEAVLRAHKSRRMSGNFDMASFGLSGAIEILQAVPNLTLQSIELGGLGTLKSGYDGEIGWTMDPLSDNVVLEGSMLNDMLRQAELRLSLNYQSVYPEQETVGTAEVDGQQMYLVKLTDKMGREVDAYFSMATGLLARIDAIVASPSATGRTITDFSDYREFDGEWVAMRLTINQVGQEFQIQFDRVTFNDASPEDFSLPEAIKRLIL